MPVRRWELGSARGAELVYAGQTSVSSMVIGLHAGKPSQAVVQVCLY